MQTEHNSVILSCIRIKARFRSSKPKLNFFLDHSKAVLLLRLVWLSVIATVLLCLVILGSPSLLSVLREGCPFWLWHFLVNIIYTDGSLYLEFQGTLWNTSRYPYLDISDLQKWGKIIRTTTFNTFICNWTLDFSDISKMWKRGEIAPEEKFLLFSTIFYLPVVRFSCLVNNKIFTSR